MVKNKNTERILAHIHEMLEPWIKKGEPENYFRVKSYISNGDDAVFSKGLLISGVEDVKDKVVFGRSFADETEKSIYNAITSKNLEELSLNDLMVIEEAVSMYIEREKIAPAVIRDHSNDFSSNPDSDSFVHVDFGRPVDGEMRRINKNIMDGDDNEAVFPDYDQAIIYAEEASLALERRGHLWNLHDQLLHITMEVYDRRFIDLADKYNGEVEVSHEKGIPLMMATFEVSRDARRFHEDIHRLLETEYYETTPWFKVNDYLHSIIPAAGMAIPLGKPMDVYYRVSDIADGELRNVTSVSCTLEGRYVLSNASLTKGVYIEDLSKYSAEKVQEALHNYQLVRDAVYDRITGSGRQLNEYQRNLIDSFTVFMTPKEKHQLFDGVFNSLAGDLDDRIPEKWIADARLELNDLADGITREQGQVLKR